MRQLISAVLAVVCLGLISVASVWPAEPLKADAGRFEVAARPPASGGTLGPSAAPEGGDRAAPLWSPQAQEVTSAPEPDRLEVASAGQEQLPQPTRSPTAAGSPDQPQRTKEQIPPTPPASRQPGIRHAHVTVIGNNGYVDGALVMGWSLARRSKLAAEGKADVICIATAGRVSPGNLRRLQQAGYTRVLEVKGLAARVPRSSWKDTFDKLYVFNLTEYDRVAYWDADMLTLGNPDGVFGTPLRSEWFIGAIGGGKKNGRPYFQSGMMVIQPTRVLFDALWDTVQSRPGPMDMYTPRNRSNYYNQHHSRDGLLLRNFFGSRFKSVSKKFSHNIGAFEKVGSSVALHFRGGWKPWNNRKLPVPKGRRRDARKEFGYGYLAWWSEYEHLHTSQWAGESWGGAGESPSTHVWMMRDTSQQYRQLLSRADATQRNVTITGMRAVAAARNVSCAAACGGGWRCSEASLRHWPVAGSCSVLRTAFKCKGCEPAIRRSAAPGMVSDGGGTCLLQMLLDDRFLPTCDSADASVERLCPCVKGSAEAVVPWDGAINFLGIDGK